MTLERVYTLRAALAYLPGFRDALQLATWLSHHRDLGIAQRYCRHGRIGPGRRRYRYLTESEIARIATELWRRGRPRRERERERLERDGLTPPRDAVTNHDPNGNDASNAAILPTARAEQGTHEDEAFRASRVREEERAPSAPQAPSRSRRSMSVDARGQEVT